MQNYMQFSQFSMAEIEVIGVGLGRTGTMSLKLALEELGYKVFHTKEMFYHHSIFALFHQHVFMQPSAETLPTQHLDEIMDEIEGNGFTATTDMPLSLFYKELSKRYKNKGKQRKFILTTRSSSEKWLESWSTLMDNVFLLPRFLFYLPNVHMIERYNRWLLAFLTKDNVFIDSDSLPLGMIKSKMNAANTSITHAYAHHNKQVRSFFSPTRMFVTRHGHSLLDFQVQDGWGPLCAFLDKDVPNKDFPRVNSSQEVNILFKSICFGSVIIPVLFIFFLLRKIVSLPNVKSSSGKKKRRRNKKTKNKESMTTG